MKVDKVIISCRLSYQKASNDQCTITWQLTRYSTSSSLSWDVCPLGNIKGDIYFSGTRAVQELNKCMNETWAIKPVGGTTTSQIT